MIPLPSGLASTSSQFDDSPQVRGAVAFAQMMQRQLPAMTAVLRLHGIDPFPGEPGQSAIDRHAALVIGSAYRSADRR